MIFFAFLAQPHLRALYAEIDGDEVLDALSASLEMRMQDTGEPSPDAVFETEESVSDDISAEEAADVSDAEFPIPDPEPDVGDAHDEMFVSVTSPLCVAGEYEALKQKVDELRGLLENIRAPAPSAIATSDGIGRLQELERKRFESNYLRKEIEKRNEMLLDFSEILETTLEFLKDRMSVFDEMEKHADRQAREIALLREEMEEQKKTLDLLRLGNFEYYEVREGDTCGSIAALPAIYDDASKEQYIRQVNRDFVDDPDNLVPGQMLIIPRFPPSGRYEF